MAGSGAADRVEMSRPFWSASSTALTTSNTSSSSSLSMPAAVAVNIATRAKNKARRSDGTVAAGEARQREAR